MNQTNREGDNDTVNISNFEAALLQLAFVVTLLRDTDITLYLFFIIDLLNNCMIHIVMIY